MELESTIFFSVVIFMWMSYLWSTYLDHRQRKIYKTVEKVPSDAVETMDQETFTKARLYNLEKSNFAFWKELWGTIESTLILYYFAIPYLWNISVKHLDLMGLGFTNDKEILASMVFITYVTVYSKITGLPWSIYHTFVIEERHGFNKQTAWFYTKDKIKSFILSLVLGLPITAGLLAVIQWGGPHFYIYAWLFTFVVTIFLMFIYPNWIAPLFDKYEPLPDGLLKSDIEALAASIEFPLKKLFVVEGSKRSSHSNAYFYGFWKNKRIVLFDTLIEGFKFPNATEEDKPDANGDKEKKPKGCKHHEILAILGHELGHWKMNHVNYNLLISNVNTFLMFFLFGQLLNTDVFFSSFGFPSGTAPLLIRLIVIFQFIFSPYNELLGFCMTYLSRLFEFQADNFAVEMGRGSSLASGLVKLQVDNLSFPLNDWLYSAYNFSHPPVLERLAVIKKKDQKSKSQ